VFSKFKIVRTAALSLAERLFANFESTSDPPNHGFKVGTHRKTGDLQTFSRFASYWLLTVFTTTETLTRVPVGRPFATGRDDPALLPIRLALLVAFVVGFGYQVLVLRRNTRNLRNLGRGNSSAAESVSPHTTQQVAIVR
jgi:hypothetical protein